MTDLGGRARLTRDEIIDTLRTLPPDDATERPVFLAKIEAGVGELDDGEGVPHGEAKRRIGV